LMEGRSGVGLITRFDASGFDTKIAAEVRDFDPAAFLEKKDVRRNDRFVQFAYGATRLALDDARFTITPQNAGQVGILIGSGIGGAETWESQHTILLERGPSRVSPFFVPMIIVNTAAGIVSILTGAKGPNLALVTACATGANAIGDGASRSMANALRDAAMEPAEVQYINAHGTSTPYNDRTETLAIKRVFGAQATKVAVSSTKSMTAHLFGAAGAVELVACCLALQHQMMPPTINYEFPDPECDLDYVPNAPRPATLDAAMSNAFGFGGHNATLIVRRYDRR